jgi:hypothetical protein
LQLFCWHAGKIVYLAPTLARLIQTCERCDPKHDASREVIEKMKAQLKRLEADESRERTDEPRILAEQEEKRKKIASLRRMQTACQIVGCLGAALILIGFSIEQ